MISIVRERKQESFYDVSEGQFFLYEDELHLKLPCHNAFCFNTKQKCGHREGELVEFCDPATEVVPVDVKITRKD